MQKLILFVSATVVLLSAVNPVGAFAPDAGSRALEIPLPVFDLHRFDTPETQQAKAQAVRVAQDNYGGRWGVYSWNPQTQTPGFLFGSGVQLAAAPLSDADAEALAREVVSRNRAALGVSDPDGDLTFAGVRRGMGKVTCRFDQVYGGLPVWGGRVHTTFTEEGRLFVMGSTVYPVSGLSVLPAVPASVAEGMALEDLPYDGRTDFVEEGASLLVLPVPRSETEVDYHLVWRVRVHTQEPVGIWVTHVDAHDGAVLWRYNDVHFLDYVGSSRGDVQPHTWCNGEEDQPLHYMDIEVVGVGTTETDEDGNWTLANGDEVPRTVNARLYGRYVNVNVFQGTDALLTGMAVPGEPFDFRFNDGNSRQDERDVFDAVSDMMEFFAIFDQDFVDGTGRIQANVKLPGSCNAYWNGSINFYDQVGNCSNTGEIQGVVDHEYGHGVQHRLIGGQGHEGLGEGNSDVLANLMTRESLIGRGFTVNGCDMGIRNSKNTLIYPDNVIGQESHAAGRVIAGFHWDAYEIFSEIFGEETGRIMTAERWHFARKLLQPVYQPDQVMANFIIDDDDGNLDNGTPNWDILCEAAQNHGFECPEISVGVFIEHEVLWNTDEEGDRELLATVVATEAPLDSALILYRTDGGLFQTAVMSPTQNPDEYSGILPGLSSPQTVQYYLRGVDGLGNSRNLPGLAPFDVFEFDVALTYDAMEEPSGWTVNLEGTDDATEGIWERVDPVWTYIQPEDDATPPPGIFCWITGQAPEGGLPTDNDIDDGATSLYSPVYNLTGAALASVKYTKWFHNTRGNFANEDPWMVFVRNDGGDWVEIENTLDASDGWEEIEFELGPLFVEALGDVQFKFVAADYTNPSLVDAGLDDFMLRGTFDVSDVGPGDLPPAARFALFGGRPNPTGGSTVITFQVPEKSAVRVRVFDVSGRLVRNLVDKPMGAGVHSIEWDGRDTRGDEVASGVYYYRMEAAGFAATRSLVLSR